MQRFSVVGLSHKFAPLEIRECLAINDATLPLALRMLRERFGIGEAVIVSTCNRVEIYAFGTRGSIRRKVIQFLSEFHHVSEDFFAEYLYEHQGLAAVEHAFRVASSLDSLVLGENQILNQFKTAYQASSTESACGKALNALMHKAFSVAKDVRSRTAINRGQLSIASIAVRFIQRTFENLGDKTVLVIGLGEMGLITLQHLHDQGIGSVIIANRTLEKARTFADKYQGSAIPLDLVPDYLERADVVVSQTGAPGTIIATKDVARAMKARKYRSMFLVDLAVPRDIPTEVDRLDGVYRYVVDDLQRVVDDASEARQKEVERCNTIIADALDEFRGSFRTYTVEPLITDIQIRANALIEDEMERASSRLAALNADELESVEQVVRRVANKLLHGPMRELKDDVRANGNNAEAVELVERMFLNELRSDRISKRSKDINRLLERDASGAPTHQPEPEQTRHER